MKLSTPAFVIGGIFVVAAIIFGYAAIFQHDSTLGSAAGLSAGIGAFLLWVGVGFRWGIFE